MEQQQCQETPPTTKTRAMSAPNITARNLENETRRSDTESDTFEDIQLHSVSEATCRICDEGKSKEELRLICDCEAPDGFVHVSCLEDRLTRSDQNHCHYCDYIFKVERSYKPISQLRIQLDKTRDLLLKFLWLTIYGIVIVLLQISVIILLHSSKSILFIIMEKAFVIFLILTCYWGIYHLTKHFINLRRLLLKENQTVRVIIRPIRDLSQEITNDNIDDISEHTNQ